MKIRFTSDEIFFTTIRIDTIAEDGCAGSGTGFVVNYAVGDDDHFFLVTNKHVVSGMREWCLTFHRAENGEPLIGETYQLNIIKEEDSPWFGHQDPSIDIAVLPLGAVYDFLVEAGEKIVVQYISTNSIPDEKKLDELSSLEDVIFVGYPNGVWDTKKFLPIVRRGSTATPISVDFEDEPSFIIDASVFGGSSGSPVFILNEGAWFAKTGGIVAGHRFYLVGVVSAVFYRTKFNSVVAQPIPTSTQSIVEQREMIDLGVVIKSRTVLEVIDQFFEVHKIAKK